MTMHVPPRIIATPAVRTPPTWAVLQRRLIEQTDLAWPVYRDRYTEPDGSLRFAGQLESRDGADDFYEAFVNWPTFYALGGGADILEAAKHHWRGVTRQLTRLGFLVDEFERGYDWFHLGESMVFFYGLCAADPDDAELRDRAVRFAELYLATSPTGNYDPRTRTIRAPHNGAGGPRWGISDEWRIFGSHLASMRPFGVPVPDVPGVAGWDDLDDPVKAAAVGAEMNRRLGAGDVAVNLAATGLATNAWLYDHDDRFRDWALEYLGAWEKRTEDNGGVTPDNVGPGGEVGELHGGRWYGGNYGWRWPHGIYSVGTALCAAALNGLLLTGDPDRLGIARSTLDAVYRHGIRGSVAGTPMSIRDRWDAELGDDVTRGILLVPNRHDDDGWFDYQPPQLGLPVWLWQAALDDSDHERLRRLRADGGYDWRSVRDFRNKEDAGHEAPWLAFLAGDNPGYPEAALQVALSQLNRRMALIDRDRVQPEDMHVHHWQRHNPVTTEVLLQLTTGTPQMLYNGGLLPTRIAYRDLDRRRPGLPLDVAALVESVTPDTTALRLVNLSPRHRRRLVITSGSLAEDRIDSVRATGESGAEPYPGDPRTYTAPIGDVWQSTTRVGDDRFEVVLPPATTVALELHLTRRAQRPRYQKVDDQGDTA